VPSLRDIRNRITSVKSTRQITKAMKMVAAAKLRRAQDAVLKARPYAQLLDKALGRVAARALAEGAAVDPLLAPRVPRDRLVVAESGLETAADLARLSRIGVNAFLIGESLMRKADVAAATRTILTPAESAAT
jgi:hypothetical protein